MQPDLRQVPAEAPDTNRVVQADGLDERISAEQVHAAADAGIRGPGRPLPYLDTIQKAFGRHRVSHAVAHLDQAAASAAQDMGARAFATGHHVAFRGQPSLHTVAHEAAHVIQQQASVKLQGGVGAQGDPYERNADAVADAVVRGESAEPLLAKFAPRSQVAQPSVQMIGEGQAIRENKASGMLRGNVRHDLMQSQFGAAPADDFAGDLVNLEAPTDHAVAFRAALEQAVLAHVVGVTNHDEFGKWIEQNKWHLTRYISAVVRGGNCENWAMAVGSRLIENTQGQWVHTAIFDKKDHAFVVTYPTQLPKGLLTRRINLDQAMVADGWWDNQVMSLRTALTNNVWETDFRLSEIRILEAKQATGANAHDQIFPPQVLHTITTTIPPLWQAFTRSNMYRIRKADAELGNHIYDVSITGNVAVLHEDAVVVWENASGGRASDLRRDLTKWGERADARISESSFARGPAWQSTFAEIAALEGTTRTKMYKCMNDVAKNQVRKRMLQALTGPQVWQYVTENAIANNASPMNASARWGSKPTMHHVVQNLTTGQLRAIKAHIAADKWQNLVHGHLTKTQRNAVAG